MNYTRPYAYYDTCSEIVALGVFGPEDGSVLQILGRMLDVCDQKWCGCKNGGVRGMLCSWHLYSDGGLCPLRLSEPAASVPYVRPYEARAGRFRRCAKVVAELFFRSGVQACSAGVLLHPSYGMLGPRPHATDNFVENMITPYRLTKAVS